MSSHRVSAILVVHDGATWLPEVVASLASQTRAFDHIVAVDTGSVDASAKLLSKRSRFGGLNRPFFTRRHPENSIPKCAAGDTKVQLLRGAGPSPCWAALGVKYETRFAYVYK
mgnify:CR=1 FL=1